MWRVKKGPCTVAIHKIILLWPNIGLPIGTSWDIEGYYHIETSPLICSANQYTGFYMVEISVMKELVVYRKFLILQKPKTLPKVYDGIFLRE